MVLFSEPHPLYYLFQLSEDCLRKPAQEDLLSPRKTVPYLGNFDCQHPLDRGKSKRVQKNIYFFCFIDYAKDFDCVDHNKLWKILKEMGIPDHLICLLRNLYAGQEATVRSGHGTIDWFQIRKGVCQGSILSPCLFKLCAEDIM